MERPPCRRVLKGETRRGHLRILRPADIQHPNRPRAHGLPCYAASRRAHPQGPRRLLDLRFREAMGHSVLDEILHVRLERVADLLLQPDMPIGAIAAFSGFGTERELNKLFRKRFSCSCANGASSTQNRKGSLALAPSVPLYLCVRQHCRMVADTPQMQITRPAVYTSRRGAPQSRRNVL